MRAVIPSSDEIRALLAPFSHAEMQQLAADSGVPFTTLWKVRVGGEEGTKNPGIETVRRFLPHAVRMSKSKAAA